MGRGVLQVTGGSVGLAGTSSDLRSRCEFWGFEWRADSVRLSFHRVPTVPVKNLNGSSPVNPALAGKCLSRGGQRKAAKGVVSIYKRERIA